MTIRQIAIRVYVHLARQASKPRRHVGQQNSPSALIAEGWTDPFFEA